MMQRYKNLHENPRVSYIFLHENSGVFHIFLHLHSFRQVMIRGDGGDRAGWR